MKVGDTAKTIAARYKGETAIEEITGAEGATAKGLAIFPKDPSRKLLVSFFDEGMTKLSAIGPAAGASHWTIAGLKLGSSLADVAKANGGKFEISGFELGLWRLCHGPQGRQAFLLDGGCVVTIRFNPPEGKEVPAALSGEKERCLVRRHARQAEPACQRNPVGLARRRGRQRLGRLRHEEHDLG